jgi:hypothetical protein
MIVADDESGLGRPEPQGSLASGNAAGLTYPRTTGEWEGGIFLFESAASR